MSRRRPARRSTLLAALLPALLLAACTATGEGSERLAVSARSWVLVGEDAGIAVRAGGALAERDLRLTVAVNDGLLDGDWKLARGAATVRIPAGKLAPGAQRILVKCGTERSTIVIRVVSMGRVFAIAAAVAVLGALLVARALRPRRSTAG